MRAVVVAVLLLASAAAHARDWTFSGTIGGEAIEIVLHDRAPIIGATWWQAEEPRRTYDMPLTTIRLLTGTRDGDRLVLREWDDAVGPERSLIEARIDDNRLRGTWRRHGSAPVRFELEEGGHLLSASRDVPYDRLHAAIRAHDWPVAMHYAQLVCGLSSWWEDCGWVEAISFLSQGKTPPPREPGRHAPWVGLVLEREGRTREAIISWEYECWAHEYIGCLFLREYFPPSEAERRHGALIDAAHRGDAARVKLLLRETFDVNVGEHPPLLAAVEGGSLEVVNLLLAAGADPNFGPGYSNPLDRAVSGGQEDIALALLDHGAVAGEMLWDAVFERRGAIVRKILANGEHPDSVLVPAGSALTAAVDNGDVELVRLLLAHGADPTVSTNHSLGSPIDHAREQGRRRILLMLLSARGTSTRP